MPAPPKPPRTPPKPRRPIARTAPLPRQSKPIARLTRPRPMSDRKRAEVKLRTEVTRPAVLERDRVMTSTRFCVPADRPRCRACGAHTIPGYRWLEVNEEPPRSLGGDPNDPADCVTLCATVDGDGCHQRRTAGKLRITKGPDGCNAPVGFEEGGRSWQG